MERLVRRTGALGVGGGDEPGDVGICVFDFFVFLADLVGYNCSLSGGQEGEGCDGSCEAHFLCCGLGNI